MCHPCDFGSCNGSNCIDCITEPAVLSCAELDAIERGARQYEAEYKAKHTPSFLDTYLKERHPNSPNSQYCHYRGPNTCPGIYDEHGICTVCGTPRQ